jgi:hypothetical protein
MSRVGFIRPRDGGGFLVGAQDESTDYSGPVAEVYGDQTWVFVITDAYEGVAMLNREALPQLIEALQQIASAPETPLKRCKPA